MTQVSASGLVSRSDLIISLYLMIKNIYIHKIPSHSKKVRQCFEQYVKATPEGSLLLIQCIFTPTIMTPYVFYGLSPNCLCNKYSYKMRHCSFIKVITSEMALTHMN